MSGGRLAAPAGLLIDRDRPIRFRFEGRDYPGFAGDCIASALAANGQWLLSRSFKYRRPRGVLSMAGHDANALAQLDGEPNVAADRRPIADGLRVRGQNYSGSLARDRGAWIGRFGRFLPAGFYYHAFFRPRGAWRWWEPIVRRRAGLGAVDTGARPGYYDKSHLFADVAVIGGGPAGLAAALAAARSGAEVALVDENPIPGGALTYARFDPEGVRADALRRRLTAEIEAEAGVTMLTDAVCQGCFEDGWLAVTRGNRLFKLRAGRVVVATGAIEQPMVFRNNDLPGVMLASAAQRLMRLYAVKPGRRAVVATANEDGYGAALDLRDAGVEVAAVADLRPRPPDGPLREAARASGLVVRDGHAVFEAEGRRHVRAARIAPITGRGECAGRAATIDCDLLCMAVGYAPQAGLLLQAGAAYEYDEASAMPVLARSPDGIAAAGAVGGVHALDDAMADGARAGRGEAGALGRAAADVTHPWPIFPHPKGKEFVDFDEDIQIADLLEAVAAGFDDVELLKRYTTVGMGPSQGRHSNLAAIRLCAGATGRAPAALGATTARPPCRPEAFGLLAGRSFEPVRRTAMHDRHLEAGAEMTVAGQWLRPAWYGTGPDAAREEALAVRQALGLIDVSTLGRIELRGPDAAAFLERVCTFAYANQPVGRSRYVLMTDRTGAIVDDGVACRFDAGHFFVTATTGGVDATCREMLWWNAQWRLDVDITNVTAAYAAVNLAGPHARAALAPLCEGVDLSPEAFPYLGLRTGKVAGIPARLLRVGFVGELGYEIHAPARFGEALWDRLVEAGGKFGLRPFGVEAQRLLRLEKGHIIVGQDTDGLTWPQEADMAWAISRRKPFFVGGRAIDIRNRRGPTRKLVGFTLDDPDGPIPAECHLVIRDDEIAGRVTSCARSVARDDVIGLAFVPADQAEPGTGFDIRCDGGRMARATVAALPFYDPGNARQEVAG